MWCCSTGGLLQWKFSFLPFQLFFSLIFRSAQMDVGFLKPYLKKEAFIYPCEEGFFIVEFYLPKERDFVLNYIPWSWGTSIYYLWNLGLLLSTLLQILFVKLLCGSYSQIYLFIFGVQPLFETLVKLLEGIITKFWKQRNNASLHMLAFV